MIKITTRVDINQKRREGGWPALVQRVERAQLGPKAVKVGFPRGKARPDVVQIAIWNHFGTRGGSSGGGWGGPIPPRPFLTYALWGNQAEIRMRLRQVARDMIRDRSTVRIGLGRVGLFAQGLIQAEIGKGVPPPNSPVTIRLKGSSKPLIDTGRMRGAVTWDYD